MLDYPTTLEDAQKVRYGAWAGFPNGHAYRQGDCAYQVWTSGRGMTASQCSHKNGYGAAGLYCKVHARKLGMIEGPKPKPRKRSFTQVLIDNVKELRKENAKLKAEIRRLHNGGESQ